jgi:hypothetical protein
MAPLHFLGAVTKPAPRLRAYERDAIIKRLAQIEVAIGHPQRTAEQKSAIVRERTELERTLAADNPAE